MRNLALLALVLGISVAACASGPTGPDMLNAPAGSFSKASGAQTAPSLAAWDANGNKWVCVKQVPAGQGVGNTAAKTIVKDDDNMVCPGGFTLQQTVTGPGGEY